MTEPICTSHWCLVMSFWLKVCIYSHTRAVKLGLQTCQPVRILRSGHAFWPQSTQVRFVTLNYAKTWWRLCARTVAYLNHATAMKEDFDQSERWVHSPSNMWDDWQMRNVRPIIKKRLQIDSKTKSRSVSCLFTPTVWFLKRGQYTRYLQLR